MRILIALTPLISLLLWVNFNDATISAGALVALVGVFIVTTLINNFIGFSHGLHYSEHQIKKEISS